ncbi:MAG: 23S rRNA (adenine(2503)-C(2))-methyltransferase RlmN [Spirochaetes bacterium]|nr:23S rRNA (adenine(2503)-C(2))-methyltransferase RlmN [Spirochaetota bacterium]
MYSIAKDKDGTIKVSLDLGGPFPIEAVLLKTPSGRRTACLSTQLGCVLGCKFCKTGTLGWVRNLSSDEILAQYEALAQTAAPPSNVVFMGMGEPLANLAEVKKAIHLLLRRSKDAPALRHITVSTAGMVPSIYRLAQEGPAVYLTLSVLSVREEVRRTLMPGVSAFSLTETKEALLYYRNRTRKRPTLAVVLIKGVNDTMEDAYLLAEYAKDLNPLVNLIPYNPVAGLPYESPADDIIQLFYQILTTAKIPTVRRFPRGRGVYGACGQLGHSRINTARILRTPAEEDCSF